MKTLLWFAPLLIAAQPVAAQICNPACANQPAQCCAQPENDQFVAEECTTVSSTHVHFVVPGTGTGWVDLRTPAQFSVSGLAGHATFGDVMPVTFGFTIGTSAASARFQVINTSLTLVGQCVGVAGVQYTGLPSMVSFEGRALTVLKAGSLFCRADIVPGAFPDLLCLQVRGQVGPPFQAQELCSPDRVEYLCAAVTP